VRSIYLLPLTLLLAACPKSDGSTPTGDAPASQAAPPPAAPPPEAPPPAAPPPEAPPPAATPAAGTAGAPCAATAECGAGLACTTEQGACDRPPGCGPEDMCAAVCYGVCAAPQASAPNPEPTPTPGPACETDADCVTFSSYCKGCGCLALKKGTKPPKCPSKPVNCLVDPCRGRSVSCQAGQCVVGEMER